MEKQQQLIIYTDGGSRGNPGPAAAAFIIFDFKNNLVDQKGFYLGKATNNVAEYSAVEEAMKWLLLNKVKFGKITVVFKLDSLLAVSQLNGSYKIKNLVLKQKIINIKNLEHKLGLSVIYSHISRADNKLADCLVNEVLNKYLVGK